MLDAYLFSLLSHPLPGVLSDVIMCASSIAVYMSTAVVLSLGTHKKKAPKVFER